ncbi:MAG: hypothetical protein ACR2IV_05840 [Bryobacteraceae bacterium]
MTKLLTLILLASGLAFAQDPGMHWFGYTFYSSDGTPLSAGEVAYVPVPRGCTLLHSWDLLINQPGTARVDVWRTAYPFFPTSANNITGGSSPVVNSGKHTYSTNLSAWKTTIAAHDVFAFYLAYITGGATQATVVLACQ